MDNKSIKENIYRLRRQLDLTQQQMADKIGISRVAYNKLESRSTKIINESLESMAELANIPVEQVYLGYTPAPEGPPLEDIRAEFDLKREEAEQRYKTEIRHKEKELEAMAALLAAKNEVIQYQSQIINMLQRRIGEENV